jgi:hypothetical protein
MPIELETGERLNFPSQLQGTFLSPVSAVASALLRAGHRRKKGLLWIAFPPFRHHSRTLVRLCGGLTSFASKRR